MALSYDLKYVHGKSFADESAADVLQAVADFAAEATGYTILSVNLGYNGEEVTADVMYEG